MFGFATFVVVVLFGGVEGAFVVALIVAVVVAVVVVVFDLVGVDGGLGFAIVAIFSVFERDASAKLLVLISLLLVVLLF